MYRAVSIASWAALAAVAAVAQSNIDPNHKSAWCENLGWTNWLDAGTPPGDQGVVVGDTILAGFIWAENVGWINVGDGSPADGEFYGNVTGSDFGVNIKPSTGELSGYAWAENIGWINFAGGAYATPPATPRIDLLADPPRLRGFVWSENAGWINLDHSTHYVAFTPAACLPCDTNCDGSVNGFDVDSFVEVLTSGGTPCSPCAGDVNSDGSVSGFDIDGFVACLGG
ncbi:MAG: hypothetical protein CHACPFDD_00111 [Phycisphaerae bacterium]|nr:hypothetical protein [Phycisphaerae bacterium]